MNNPTKSSLTQTEKILSKALVGEDLAHEDLTHLLSLRSPKQTALLFKTAQTLRHRYFGQMVFLYGFLYVSTHCRNHCTFCLFRHGNVKAARYRKTLDEIICLAQKLAQSGVHLIDLTMGEDPLFYQNGREGFAELVEMIREVLQAVKLPVMVSAGVLREPVLDQLAGLGVSWYACYQETHSLPLFNRLRQGQSYNNRFKSKAVAHRKGMLVEEGILAGVGETHDDIVNSLVTMQTFGADQIRVMSLVPQQGTPMADIPDPDPMLELKIIALMRLLMPDRLIPASLDVEGVAGLKQRLDAGANVVTSLMPADAGLAGVAQSELDIAEGHRSVDGIAAILKSSGLSPASPEQYRQWVIKRRKRLDN